MSKLSICPFLRKHTQASTNTCSTNTQPKQLQQNKTQQQQQVTSNKSKQNNNKSKRTLFLDTHIKFDTCNSNLTQQNIIFTFCTQITLNIQQNSPDKLSTQL